jgi:hypothetical protein
MRLQLKNVYFSERLSQETNAFAADVYLDNRKFATAENDGHGGPTLVKSLNKKDELFNEAVKYAKNSPDIQTKFLNEDGLPVTYASNLENQVDNMLVEWLERKQLVKNSRKGLYIEDKVKNRFLISWNLPMNKLLAHPKGKDIVKEAIAKKKKEGYIILNNNLGSLLAK